MYMNGSRNVSVKDIIVVPSISKNLLSVNKLCRDNNFGFWFDPSHVCVLDLQIKELIVDGKYVDEMYELELKDDVSNKSEVNLVVKILLDLWHLHLGNVNKNLIQEIVKHTFSVRW